MSQSNSSKIMHANAGIKSGYYILDKQQYSSVDIAWSALKSYIKTKHDLSGYTDNDETIIYNEESHEITIITKNKKLPLDRYVPIQDPVILDPLSGNIKI